MNIDWALVVDAAKGLAWPSVTVFALYTFRHQLVELLTHLGRRATKVSIFEVSIELASLPELKPSWSVGNEDPRRLNSSVIFDSASQTLFNELLKPAGTDFAVVDLATDQSWLTSRLFVFALVLGEVSGLRAFVFLEYAHDTRRRFLGTASPAAIRRALGQRYPWFEEASARALAEQYGPPPTPDLIRSSAFNGWLGPLADANPAQVSGFVRKFIELLQRTTDPPIQEEASYLTLGPTSSALVRERTRWIDGALLEEDLFGVLEKSWVEDSPDLSRSRVTESILRQTSSFVALVNSDRQFVSLVDRFALLHQSWMSKGDTSSGTDRN
jgi:hypothetical protein